MLAGAHGIDLVLLVVAADDGVMPQTREHLAIIELLGIPQALVAITKCDRVEPARLVEVQAQVTELLATGPYAGAPQFRFQASPVRESRHCAKQWSRRKAACASAAWVGAFALPSIAPSL